MKPTPIRLFSRAAMMLLMMLLTTVTAWAETENLGGYEFTIGTDGEGQYYKVDCKEALDAIATFVNGGGYTGGKRFKQTANITYTHTTDWNDANSTENNYTAIGYYDDDDGYYSFYGTYDGGGYTISGIRIYKSDECQGLFGSAYGTVKNVTLTDARITGGDSTAGIVGDLTDDAVSNCRVASNVAIHNAVPSTSYYGGVVGYNDDGTVSDCFSAATISTKGVQFGAIVGYNNGTLLRNTYIYTTCYGVGTGKKTSGDVTENNGAVNASPDHFTDNGDDTYTIKSALGWDVFCGLLATEAKGYFTGKTIYLNGNIEVSRMAGDSGHKFTGTFNGQGNTLTVSYSGSSYVAPFSYVDGATIQNLVVEGTISSTSTRAAGVIGETGSPGEGGTTTSHIINCVSSSTITGGNYSGGFSIGGNVEIEGCVFNGTINISGDYGGGGFVGYSQSALTITNSLFAPQSGSSAKGTFYYNGTAGTITNSYYTTALGTAQGKKACPATAAPVGDATHATYSVSQITPYANGLTCGETFYYGGGDIVSVNYVDEHGDNATHVATAIGSTYMPGFFNPNYDSNKDGDLDQGWYYVAEDVTYTDDDECMPNIIIYLATNATLILGDGKKMNIGTSNNRISKLCIFDDNDHSLTIYGQSSQSGQLNVYGCFNSAAYNFASIFVSNYTQHGGKVNIDEEIEDMDAFRSSYISTITGGTLTVNGINYGNLTVSGGTVSITGDSCDGDVIVSGGTVSITGNIGNGDLTVSGGTVNVGGSIIYVNFSGGTVIVGGDILHANLSWTSPDDRFTANSYGFYANDPTVTIADSKSFYNGSEVLSGVITDMSQVNGKTLKPALNITLPKGVIVTGTGVFTQADGTYALPGATVTVTLGAAGYTLSDVSSSEVTISETEGVYSFTMPASDVTITATLTAFPWDGTGEVDSPYVIEYPSQLDLLATNVNGGNDYVNTYFVLGADITYTHKADNEEGADTENNYTAIGYYDGSNYYDFKGHFDGRGHTVSGIRINKDGSDKTDQCQGLFGCTDGATIQNITLADTRITGYHGTGGIVGYNKSGGTVTDCHVTATVTIHAVQSNAANHGGIVGYNEGTVSNCTSATTLTTTSGGSGYGGIAGVNDGTLSNNLAIGAVVPSASWSYYGAICGGNDEGTLRHNYYYGCTAMGCHNENITKNDGAVPGIILYDNSSKTDINSYILTTVGNEEVSRVFLSGRTLYKDGNWNTLCLPFNLGNSSAEEGHHFDGTPLADATVMELDGTTSGFDASSGTLTLNFNTANSISAGKPYIIKWASADDLVNPLFRDVTINATNSPVTSQDGKVQFRGIYDPAMIYSADHDNLFLGIGKNNQNEDVSMLYWPNTTDYTLGAFRAYFHVNLTETNGVRDIVLNFEDGTQTTGIIGHTDNTDNTDKADAAWYSLDGRKLDGKPTKKGLYIYKGRKVAKQ